MSPDRPAAPSPKQRSTCRPAAAAGPRHETARGSHAPSAPPEDRGPEAAPTPCPGGTRRDPLPARRPPPTAPALHHLRRAQAALALLYLDLAVDDRSRAGQAERLDQPRHPRMSRDQPGLEFRVDFKIKPIRHARPRTQRVKLTAPADSTAESIAAEENYRRRSQPILLAGE